MQLANPGDYQKIILVDEEFDALNKEGVIHEGDNAIYQFAENQEFYLFFESPYEELTQKDHIWVKASFDVRFPDNFEGPLPVS